MPIYGIVVFMKYADGKTMHELFRALFAARNATAEIEEAVHQAAGLTGSQKKNLGYLLSEGPMTISELACVRGVSRQSVQVAISALTRQGYVHLNDNPRHKQAKLITVTEQGRARFLQCETREHSLIEGFFSEMDKNQVLATTDLLNNLTEILQRRSVADYVRKTE
jgi:DNA-binding MarR family transcriptional regulator